MALFHPKRGAPWPGKAAICDDASVDHRHGFYALTDDGKHLLLVRGKPVRLTCVTDGALHAYFVANKTDPPTQRGRIVGFEADHEGEGSVEL